MTITAHLPARSVTRTRVVSRAVVSPRIEATGRGCASNRQPGTRDYFPRTLANHVCAHADASWNTQAPLIAIGNMEHVSPTQRSLSRQCLKCKVSAPTLSDDFQTEFESSLARRIRASTKWREGQRLR